MPPASLTWETQIWKASRSEVPSNATGPVSGDHIPRTISVSVTPGSAATAGEAQTRPIRSRSVPRIRSSMVGLLPELQQLDFSPNLLCHLDHVTELGPFLLDGEGVALIDAGEPALRAEGQLLHRHVSSGLVDPALQHVSGLELGPLGRDQSQDDDLVLAPQVAEWREVPRPLVVVLQEVAVDLHLTEQGLGDVLVPAGRDPGAAHVSPTHVDADDLAPGTI